MTERTVVIGMVTYTGPDGVRRIGVQGERVDVADSDLKRFDDVQGVVRVDVPKKQAPAKKAAPKKR
jgi:hypothetical protein